MTSQTNASALERAACLLSVCGWIAIMCAGCEVDHSVTEEDGVGLAVLAVREVPADVRCIRIKAALSTRSLSRDFNVEPGSRDVLQLSGLSLGDATFWGEAFGVACGDLTPDTPSTWTSTPSDVTITPGEPVAINLVLQRSGTGTINVDFRDLDAACMLGSGEDRVCGRCGIQTRSCGDDGFWSDWSACAKQGPCLPGDVRGCGAGGMRTCTDACTWSECVEPVCPGPRECIPGSMGSCSMGGVRECTADCVWAACTCRVPFTNCGDTCFDLTRDRMHCGSCSTVCAPNQICNRGVCVP